jgi:hypothetical protein
MNKQFTLTIALLLFFLLGCNLIEQGIRKLDETSEPKIIKSRDRKVQVQVPASWREEKSLNEDAMLQASNRLSEVYVVIIGESKKDFSGQMSLNDFTQLVQSGIVEQLKNPEVTKFTPINVSSYQARQFEASGEIEKINVKYLYATVETPGSFYQVITWTLPSRYERNKPILEKVINSFKENTPDSEDMPLPTPSGNRKK